MTTVSIKGSNKATKPSEAGWLVVTAECAMAADPAPASLEKAARRKSLNHDANNTARDCCSR